MGTIKATNIEPIADNGTVTLGSSGDTLTVPTGVTVSGGVANTPAFSVYGSAQTGVTENVATLSVFTSEHYDTDNAFDTSASNYKFTVPSGKAGKYHFSVIMGLTGNTSQIFLDEVVLYKNGSGFYNLYFWRSASQRYQTNYVGGSATLDLAVGDYIQVYSRNRTSDGSTVTHSGYVFTGHRLTGV